jgi:hypothetical protein
LSAGEIRAHPSSIPHTKLELRLIDMSHGRIDKEDTSHDSTARKPMRTLYRHKRGSITKAHDAMLYQQWKFAAQCKPEAL